MRLRAMDLPDSVQPVFLRKAARVLLMAKEAFKQSWKDLVKRAGIDGLPFTICGA